MFRAVKSILEGMKMYLAVGLAIQIVFILLIFRLNEFYQPTPGSKPFDDGIMGLLLFWGTLLPLAAMAFGVSGVEGKRQGLSRLYASLPVDLHQIGLIMILPLIIGTGLFAVTWCLIMSFFPGLFQTAHYYSLLSLHAGIIVVGIEIQIRILLKREIRAWRIFGRISDVVFFTILLSGMFLGRITGHKSLMWEPTRSVLDLMDQPTTPILFLMFSTLLLLIYLYFVSRKRSLMEWN